MFDASTNAQAVNDSCFVKKLTHYVTLSDGDRQLLAALEQDEQEFGPREDVHKEGDPDAKLYVVEKGWLFSWTLLNDGRRQVDDIHVPGDVIGLNYTPFLSPSSTLTTLTPAALCPFPKSGMDDIFEQSPRLTATLYSLALLQTMVFMDRLRSVSRMNAHERLAHFLLQILCRLRITNGESDNEFRLPLTQEVIGDCIGLSQVHVNRTMMQLVDEKLIRRDRDRVTIVEEEKMRELASFTDRHYKIDTSWFPQRNAPLSTA